MEGDFATRVDVDLGKRHGEYDGRMYFLVQHPIYPARGNTCTSVLDTTRDIVSIKIDKIKILHTGRKEVQLLFDPSRTDNPNALNETCGYLRSPK